MAIKIIDQKVFSFGVSFDVVGYYSKKKLGVISIDGGITHEHIKIDSVTIANSSNLFWLLKEEVKKDIKDEIIKTIMS